MVGAMEEATEKVNTSENVRLVRTFFFNAFRVQMVLQIASRFLFWLVQEAPYRCYRLCVWCNIR